MNESKRFKQLFQTNKMVDISVVVRELGLPSNDTISDLLQEWKLAEFYDITGTFVCRNDTPTRWDVLKKSLKKAGKWALTKCVPIAIGIATGGLGMGAVAAPAVAELIKKLKNRGLDVSDTSQAELENLILTKSDASIEGLMTHLQLDNKGKGITPEKLERLIRLSIKEDLHPFLAEIQAVLGTLQQEQSNLSSLFEDWALEQRNKLEGLQTGMNDQFELTLDGLDRIEYTLTPILEDLSVIKINVKETNARLNTMEEKLDALFHEVCKVSLESLSFEDLIQASRIQFQNVRLAGKFDKPYDGHLFIETPKLSQDFSAFLKEKQDTTPVFLLLASVGMGKTWNAVHLGIAAREMELAIPLFIPIHLGYSSILQEFFQIDRADLSALGRIVGEKCERIHTNTGKRILLVLDGLDEYPDPNREPFLNFLRHLLQGYKHAVRILLTDRTTDWCENKQIRSFYRDITHLIHANTELKGICNLYKIATPLSGFLEGFSNTQLDLAIVQYGLDRTKFPPKLYNLCHKPYVLRIVYEREQYFDPDNVDEFWSVFYDQINPVNTILDRMGITNPNDMLFPLFEAFQDATAIRKERDLHSLIDRNRIEWELILRSGLILIEQQRFEVVYKFDPVFHPIITDYLVHVGQLAPPEVQKEATEMTGSKIIASAIKEELTQAPSQIGGLEKKFQYHETLWKEALEKKEYSNASEQAKKVLALAEEEYNVDLTKKAKELINITNLYQSITQDLQPRLEKALQENNLLNAIDELGKIDNLARSNKLEPFIEYVDTIDQSIRTKAVDILKQARDALNRDVLDSALQLSGASKDIFTKLNDLEKVSNADEIRNNIKDKANILLQQANDKLKNKQWDSVIQLSDQARDIYSKLNDSDGMMKASQIKNKAKGEVTKQEKVNQLKDRYQTLADKAQREFDQQQWEVATATLNQVIQVCEQFDFSDGINWAKGMIDKINEKQKEKMGLDLLKQTSSKIDLIKQISAVSSQDGIICLGCKGMIPKDQLNNPFGVLKCPWCGTEMAAGRVVKFGPFVNEQVGTASIAPLTPVPIKPSSATKIMEDLNSSFSSWDSKPAGEPSVFYFHNMNYSSISCKRGTIVPFPVMPSLTMEDIIPEISKKFDIPEDNLAIATPGGEVLISSDYKKTIDQLYAKYGNQYHCINKKIISGEIEEKKSTSGTLDEGMNVNMLEMRCKELEMNRKELEAQLRAQEEKTTMSEMYRTMMNQLKNKKHLLDEGEQQKAFGALESMGFGASWSECPKCGLANKKGSKRCSSCGAKMKR